MGRARETMSKRPITTLLAGVMAGILLTKTGQEICRKMQKPNPVVATQPAVLPPGVPDGSVAEKEWDVIVIEPSMPVDLESMKLENLYGFYDKNVLIFDAYLTSFDHALKSFDEKTLDDMDERETQAGEIEKMIIEGLSSIAEFDRIIAEIKKRVGKEPNANKIVEDRVNNLTDALTNFKDMVDYFDEAKRKKPPHKSIDL